MNDPLFEKVQAYDTHRPLAEAETIPSDWYVDTDLALLENRTVFGNGWQCVGRTDQVPGAGHFFTADLAGEPFLVSRDEASALRAFSNVCRHRAARVCYEPQGKATRFRCRYHGWTYDLTGKLRGVPEFDGVENFDREDNGLRQFRVATWGPLVFIDAGKPERSLEDFLAPLVMSNTHNRISRLQFFERREYVLQCNWKVFVDNYLDGGYHVNTIHESLAGVLDYAEYRIELFENSSLQSSPMRAPDQTAEDASAAAVRTGESAHYWWAFPNLMLNIYEGLMDTNLVLPLGPDRCRVLFDFYFDPDYPAKHRSESIAVAERIQQEDVAICEDVQRGLKSRSFRTGRYSVRREAGVYHFHTLLAQHLVAGRRSEMAADER